MAPAASKYGNIPIHHYPESNNIVWYNNPIDLTKLERLHITNGFEKSTTNNKPLPKITISTDRSIAPGSDYVTLTYQGATIDLSVTDAVILAEELWILKNETVIRIFYYGKITLRIYIDPEDVLRVVNDLRENAQKALEARNAYCAFECGVEPLRSNHRSWCINGK